MNWLSQTTTRHTFLSWGQPLKTLPVDLQKQKSADSKPFGKLLQEKRKNKEPFNWFFLTGEKSSRCTTPVLGLVLGDNIWPMVSSLVYKRLHAPRAKLCGVLPSTSIKFSPWFGPLAIISGSSSASIWWGSGHNTPIFAICEL